MSVLKEIWEGFPKHQTAALILLFEKFEIIYRVFKGEKETIIIPSMLNTKAPSQELLYDVPFPEIFTPNGVSDNNRLYFRNYTFPFLPLGFFARFLAKCIYFPNISFEEIWRTGASIKNQLGEFAVVTSSEGITKDHSIYEYTLKISVFSKKEIEKGKRLLIQQLVEIIETLVSCHYSEKNRNCNLFYFLLFFIISIFICLILFRF